MSQVWKFVLQPEIEVEMPKGAKLLSVACQGSEICLWAKVDPNAGNETRSFVGYGTGHEIPDDMHLEFVGTALLDGGAMVFHIFEKI